MADCSRYVVDISPSACHTQTVKIAKKTVEQKTPGTMIIEKYRARMSKLTTSERQQLRDRAMRLAFGHESERAPRRRR